MASRSEKWSPDVVPDGTGELPGIATIDPAGKCTDHNYLYTAPYSTVTQLNNS